MFEMIGKKLLRLAFYSDLHATRLLLAISEFLWGVTLLAPGDTFTRPTYAVMRHICAIEEVWGIVWLVSSFLQMWILISGNYHGRLSVSFACFNSILWWVATISMYLSVTPIPAAISGEAALAIAAAWVYIRSGWLPIGARRAPYADTTE